MIKEIHTPTKNFNQCFTVTGDDLEELVLHVVDRIRESSKNFYTANLWAELQTKGTSIVDQHATLGKALTVVYSGFKPQKHLCTKCGEVLEGSRAVWLELSETDGNYYFPDSFPTGHVSQGGFAFGSTCAKNTAQKVERIFKVNLSKKTAEDVTRLFLSGQLVDENEWLRPGTSKDAEPVFVRRGNLPEVSNTIANKAWFTNYHYLTYNPFEKP